MNARLSIEGPVSDVADALRKLLGNAEVLPTGTTAEVQQPPKRKPGRPRKVQVEPTATAEEPPKRKRGRPRKNPLPEQTSETSVKDAFRNYVEQEGVDAAKELLEEFGATRLSEVSPDDYSALTAKML